MSFRHKLNILTASTVAALAVSSSPARADDAVSLAQVARELGYSYAYVPYENAVSLSRPGATVVVRPGDAFFSANERREPVYGMVPTYRNNDVYVSRRFESEIRNLGRGEREALAASETAVAPPLRPSAVQAPPGSVSALSVTYDKLSDEIVVRGRATASSLVTLYVRATLAANVPVVTVDRGATYAGADGTFAVRLGFGPDEFPESTFVVEASGSENATPVTAKVPARLR